MKPIGRENGKNEIALKEILYYLSPEIELGDPLFRFGSYRHILLPEIRALLDAGPDFNVTFVLSTAVYEAASVAGLLDERISYVCFDLNDAIDDLRWYNGAVQPDEVEARCEYLCKKLGNYSPEIVLIYEKPDFLLKYCFPHAIVLNVMFGAFSRGPFPTLASYDPQGLFGKSFLCKHAKRIRNWSVSEQEERFLKDFRRTAAAALAQFQPFKREISEIRQKFDKIILVACQVDGYFAVTATSDFPTQLDLIKAVCQSLPSNVGVIVTQHSYQRAISKEEEQCLAQAFPNFIAFDNPDNIPDASQFLVPYVDAVVTVSSSLAFQGALWQVPVIATGQSHINVIASGRTVQDLCRLVSSHYPRNDIQEIDQALIFILLRYNVIYRSAVFNGFYYADFLREIFSSLKNDPTGESFFFCRQVDFQFVKSQYDEGFTQFKLRDWFEKYKKEFSPDYLLLELSKVKVASFDLFDTLLQRPLVEPHEVFGLMEPDVRKYLNNLNFPFHRLRREAESDVRRPTRGEYEITLEEIYIRLSELSGISDEQAQTLMLMEETWELRLCSAKPLIMLYFRFAKLLCEEVGVISDFYIGREFVEKLLHKNGIETDFLYVSASEKTRKHNGTVFREVKKDLAGRGFAAADILHIGDNLTADKVMAEANGIRAYHFPKAVDNFRRSRLGELYGAALRTPQLGSSLALGVIANRFYGVSWNQIDRDTCFRGDSFLLGYLAYGPLIVGFCQWIRRQATKKGYSRLYFLARDGYIVKQVYDWLYGSSDKNVYLYSSRRAATVASLKTIDDILELGFQNFSAQPLRSFVKNRFGLDLSDSHRDVLKACSLRADSIVSPNSDMRRLTFFLRKVSNEILANASEEREAYLAYLKGIGYMDIENREKSVLIDIGYSGTMQSCLGRMVPETVANGLYLLTHNHAADRFQNAIFDGFLANLDDHRLAYRHKLNDHVFMFESGLSSLEGSLIRFRLDEEGEPRGEFIEADAEDVRRALLARIHCGIEMFARDYKAALGDVVDTATITPILAEKTLIAYAENPTKRDAAIFYGCEVENVFGGGSVCLIEPTDGLLPSKKAQENQMAELISRSRWKRGASVFYSAGMNNAPGRAELRQFKPTDSDAVKAPSLAVQRTSRKLGKLLRNPYAFFNDSRHPILRPVRHFFGVHKLGSANRAILRRLFM